MQDVLIANELKVRLHDWKMAPGDRLPCERELAEMFGVQRATIHGALERLAAENVVEIVPRSGCYYREDHLCVDYLYLDYIKRFRIDRPEAISLTLFDREKKIVDKQMALESGICIAENIQYERFGIIYKNDTVAIEENHILRRCLDSSVPDSELVVKTVYERIAQRTAIGRVRRELDLEGMLPEERRIFGKKGAMQLLIQRSYMYDQDEQLIGYSRTAFLKERIHYIKGGTHEF